jgi:hypothetical protein
MAQQGFGYGQPLYRIEQTPKSVWLSSFGKYYAAVSQIEPSTDAKTQKRDVKGIRRIQAA